MISTPKPASKPLDEDFEVPSDFRAHNRATINWVVRKIVEARHYTQRIAEFSEAETQRARREEEFFLYRFGPQMRHWLEQELAQRGGRSKSILLPAGRLGLRHSGPKIEVLDQATVLAWAKVNCPDAIKRTESILNWWSRSACDQHRHGQPPHCRRDQA